MLELNKKKTDGNTTDIIVKTNQGEFIVAKDSNGNVSIGCFKKDEKSVKPMEFRITQDDYIIYKIFFKFFKDLNVADDLEKIEIISRDFKPEEASTLTVDLDEDTADIVLTLTISDPKQWRKEYWVDAPLCTNTFNNLYNELLDYEKASNEETIFEFFEIDETSFMRSRSSKN